MSKLLVTIIVVIAVSFLNSCDEKTVTKTKPTIMTNDQAPFLDQSNKHDLNKELPIVTAAQIDALPNTMTVQEMFNLLSPTILGLDPTIYLYQSEQNDHLYIAFPHLDDKRATSNEQLTNIRIKSIYQTSGYELLNLTEADIIWRDKNTRTQQ